MIKENNLTKKEFERIINDLKIESYEDLLFKLECFYKFSADQCANDGCNVLKDIYTNNMDKIHATLKAKGYFDI